jgi:opacity protein-like surface antigen
MRNRLLALTLSGVLVASSACSDATAPSSLTAPGGAAGYHGAQLGQHDDGWSGQTAFQVTIDPRRNNELHFGSYTLSLPADAVCRLHNSGYGMSSFDEPCQPEKRPVAISARLRQDAQGRQRIDLQPEMRFNPATTVVLSMYVGQAALLSAESWRILFCPVSDPQGCVDESLLDPSLTTRIDFTRGTIYRRIKHFSGYLAAES